MKVFKAPTPYKFSTTNPIEISVFLGGSIEMGAAEDWQDQLVKEFENIDNLVFLNPRRDDWDSTWAQDPIPGTKFYEQVSWELYMQESSDINVYYFADDTKSPITLMELGLYARSDNSIVRCSPNFYRYGNIAIVCNKYNIPLVETMDDLVVHLHQRISEMQ